YVSSLSSSSIPNPTLQSYIAGALSFKYKFTDAKGCSSISDELVIQNYPNPTISIDPVEPQCASNQGVMLSANAKVDGIASATFTYLWSGDVDSKESNPLLDISTAGTKTVNLKVTSNTGCVANTTTTVVVNPNPLAEIATKDVETCSSDTITMIANASSANVDFAWSGGLEWLTDNASSVKAVIPSNATGADEISYPVTLTVTDKTTHCSSEATTSVLAHKIPQVSLGGDFELCDGSEVELKPLLNYVGTEDYTLTWFLDVTQLSSVNVENPIYTQKGTDVYKIGVQVKDANGCVGKDNISITGLENPTVDAGLDREEDWNEPFTLVGTATGAHPSYTYLWSPKDSLTTSETLQKPTAKLRQTTKFTLDVTDSKGCKGTADVTITIVGQPLSVMIEQRPEPFCFGNTVTLEAIPSGGNKGGTYKYDWYDMTNPETVIGTNKTLEVSPSSQTTYKVVLHSVGARDFVPADTIHTVVVNPLPSISLRGGLNPHVCKGDLTNLIPAVSGGSAPYTYQWMDGNPIVVKTETYQFSNSSLVGEQKIKLIVTDEIGCSDSVEVAVMVEALPELQLDPVTECVNVEATAVATATNGKAPYSYFWSGIQNMTSSANKAMFTMTEQGTYNLQVSVIDDNSCKSEAEAIVTIKPEATLAFEKAYSVCAKEDLELVLNPNNIAGFYTMHWVGGDKNRIVDSTKINRLMSTFRSDNEGVYTLYYTVADEYNCPRLDSTKITVFPAVKLVDIADMNACAGVGVEIQAEIATGNPSSYTWLGSVSPKNEKKTTFTYSTPGTYNVTVIAGDQNCSDTKEFAVTVQPNPIVEIIGAPVKKVDYTEEVSLETKIVNYTTYPFTHVWKEAANIKSGAGTDRIVTTPIVQTTDYEYTITDAFGCIGTASIRLQTEMIVPKITHFTEWKNHDAPKDELLDSNKVSLSDEGLELCEGEYAYLIPQFISGSNLETLTYTWKDDEGNSLGNDINLKITPTKYSTVYTLMVSNPAGFKTDVSFMVIMHSNPTAEIMVSPDYSGKYYTNDILSVDGQPSPTIDTYTSFWSSEPSVQFKDASAQITTISGITQEIKPLLLKYKATNQYGCSVEVSKSIDVVEQKMPVIVGPDVCIYSTSTYRLNQTYPVGTKYIWSVEGGKIESKSGDESSITVLWEQSENTTVTVSIYPPDGKDRVIEGITHIAHITPMPDISINGQIHVCVGENAAYEAINNIPTMTNMQYGWSIADDHGDLVEISDKSDVATVLWDKEGKDTVILRAMYGSCIVQQDLTVYIHPTPEVDFTYAASEDVFFVEEGVVRHTDSIFVDKDVTFTNLTPHKQGYDYFWDFIGDGVFTENSRDAVYEYDEVGDFNVTLMVVENTWGCKNEITKPLKVVANPNCGLTFPNAFTPDLSENNTFYPVFKTGVLESGYELRVYNRWGTLLWSTEDLYGEWDGVYKGSVSKQDVYVYHCKATCEDVDPETGKHRVLNVKGDVTIMR
ncbi:MAG: gliding motility-associated C-terminal domain-containing protein, partial [Bacteroidales bacterium]|nr:gliding motility-associated C-terminal domain-containing protein [Bacteroidales bacterium]